MNNGEISGKEKKVLNTLNKLNCLFSALGEGRLLEHIVNSEEMPLRQIEPSKKAALNSNKMSWHSERDR